MCRNIRTLYNFEPPVTEGEIHDAALQYVRKVSGMQKPSQANQQAFETAVAEIAHSTWQSCEPFPTGTQSFTSETTPPAEHTA